MALVPALRSSHRARHLRARILVATALLAVASTLVTAQPARMRWQAQGLAIADTNGVQRNARLATDMLDGAIVVWEDYSAGGSPALHAARILKDGTLPWTPGGVRLAAPTDALTLGGILSDDRGGVVVTWSAMAGPNIDIFAQRLDADGTPLWGAAGVIVCSAARDQVAPVVASDGTGGVIVAWEDRRSGNADIRAQRIDEAGRMLWSTDGNPVTIAAGDQVQPCIASDGFGAAFVAWTDRAIDDDVAMQRILGNGRLSWGEVLQVAVHDERQYAPVLTARTPGTAAICWIDTRGAGPAVTMQIVDTTGGETFLDALRLGVAPVAQDDLVVTADGLGGVLAAWSSKAADSAQTDLYMRRVRADGSVAGSGAQLGETLCALAVSSQRAVQVLPDGAGGGFAVWQDARAKGDDIYASRFAASGSTTLNGWPLNGIAVSTAAGVQRLPRMIAAGEGAAIVVWEDDRAGKDSTALYAQRIEWAPVLVASTDTLRLGERTTRVEARDSVIIRNTGALPMTVTNVRRTTTGNAFQDFDVQLGFTLPRTVPPDSILTIHVTCTPSAPGMRSAVLRINSNAPVDPFDLPLLATGAQARITVPGLLALGPVRLGTTRDTVVADLVSNSGDTDLIITRIDITGDNAAEFSLPALSLPLVIAPGRSASLRVRAVPEEEGVRQAALRFASNADDTLKSMLLSAAGGLPRLGTAPLALHFDDVTIGGAQTLQPLVENTGLVDLRVRAARIEGADADQFRLGSLDSLVLAPGTSVKLNVTFLPTTPGFKRSTLFVDSDDPASPASLLIDGNALMVSVQAPPHAGIFQLLGAHPSPYRIANGTVLVVTVQVSTPVVTRLQLIDLAGRTLALIDASFPTTGTHLLIVPPEHLSSLSPGTYLLRFDGAPGTLRILIH